MDNKLSVIIITYNEEDNIKSAIKSARFAQEVIVVDSGSSDLTCSIAEKNGAKVYHQNWLGYGKQKNHAIKLTKNPWVFVLDADERITSLLQKEIRSILKMPMFDGYYVPRLNSFFGKYIRSCGLYPDFSVRLFNKTKARFSESPVHEKVKLKSNAGYLKNHLLHNAYHSVDEFVNKQKKYAHLSIKKRSYFKAILSPIWTFVKIFIIRYGFVDGWRGFVIAFTYARYTFWKYKK